MCGNHEIALIGLMSIKRRFAMSLLARSVLSSMKRALLVISTMKSPRPVISYDTLPRYLIFVPPFHSSCSRRAGLLLLIPFAASPANADDHMTTCASFPIGRWWAGKCWVRPTGWLLVCIPLWPTWAKQSGMACRRDPEQFRNNTGSCRPPARHGAKNYRDTPNTKIVF